MGDGAHVFLSYAHEDAEWNERLRVHLAALRRSGQVSIWHDRQLGAGDDWRAEIRSQLETADIILLLVSADFIASDFIWEEELTVAMRRRGEGTARVIPVIVKACDWTRLEFAKLQALPPDGRPIADRDDVDQALTEVAVGIAQVLDTVAVTTDAAP